MAEDEERRQGSARPSRRDPARNVPRTPPTIEGSAEDVTPPGEPVTVVPSDQPAPSIGETPEADPQADLQADLASAAAPAHIPSDATSLPGHDDAHVAPGSATSTSSEASAGRRSPLATLTALGFLILAAGLVYLFYQLSSLPPNESAAIADLRSRLGAVETRPVADAGAVADRVAKLEAAATGTQAAVNDLGKRLDGVAGAVGKQAALTTQVADLQSALAALKTGLATLQTSVADIPRPDLGKIDARLSEVDGRLNGLQGAVSTIPHIDLGPITAKVDGLESRVRPLEAQVAATGTPDQVAQRKAAPLAVTAQAIAGAIQAGQAFPQELRALQALGADPARVAPLSAVAEAGAPSLQDLQGQLDDLRGRIVTQGAAPQTGSYVDRLVAGASSLVQVRPLGSVVGDTPSAVVSRMSAAIAGDDLAAALDDWKKLPSASQEASKTLAARIKLRLDAEQAARDIATNAIGAMGTPKG